MAILSLWMFFLLRILKFLKRDKSFKSCSVGGTANNLEKQLKLRLWSCCSYVWGGKYTVFLHFVQTAW